MMKNRFLSVFLMASIILLAGCGGSGGAGSSGDPSKLYVANLMQGSTGIGTLVGDDAGNTIVSMMTSAGSDSVGTLIADMADGSRASATIANGVPVSVTDGTTTATFSNWNGSKVDVKITSGGESETVAGVDYSEYAAQVVTTKGWPQFFGATWTTITVAFCPVSIALAGASIGAGLPAAIVGCTLAGSNLYRLLNGQSTLVEEVAIYVSAPASCAVVAESGGTSAQQQQCVSDTLTTLPSVAAYVNEYGEIVTGDDDDGGDGTVAFAGSCRLQGGTCVNYSGSDMSAADAQAGCEATGGTYSTGACSTAGIVGSCTVGAGTANEYRVVFYDTIYTLEIARETCSAMSGVFTAQ